MMMIIQHNCFSSMPQRCSTQWVMANGKDRLATCVCARVLLEYLSTHRCAAFQTKKRYQSRSLRLSPLNNATKDRDENRASEWLRLPLLITSRESLSAARNSSQK